MRRVLNVKTGDGELSLHVRVQVDYKSADEPGYTRDVSRAILEQLGDGVMKAIAALPRPTLSLCRQKVS